MSTLSAVRRVDVNGHPGWIFISIGATQEVAWQVDEDTYAYLKINDGSAADEALAIAESVRFVPAEEWESIYEVDVPGASASSASTHRFHFRSV